MLAVIRNRALAAPVSRAFVAAPILARAYNTPAAQSSTPAAQSSTTAAAAAKAKREETIASFKKKAATRRNNPAPHFLTLADYSVDEISRLVQSALALKNFAKEHTAERIPNSLNSKSVALMFSKRSTRTRVASETSVATLGGSSMFLGSGDIQLGVNESLRDTATVVGSMVDGIMARVNGHDEVETLAKYSPVPIINALSDLYHPTQILADILTIVEPYDPTAVKPPTTSTFGLYNKYVAQHIDVKKVLAGKKIAWVGDTNNMTNEFLVVFPRFGAELAIAAPKGYDQVDPRVWQRVEEGGAADKVTFTNSPAEAIKDADIIVTDTWISMGQEEEAKLRLEAFSGYQLTNELINGSGAKADWKFMHCLPRHQDEVNDEVFYGDRSLVFPEAENRKWTIMAVFKSLIGQWQKAPVAPAKQKE